MDWLGSQKLLLYCLNFDSKYGFGPVKLSGLLWKGPKGKVARRGLINLGLKGDHGYYLSRKRAFKVLFGLFQYNTELGGKKVQTKIPLQSSKTEFKIYTNLGLM